MTIHTVTEDLRRHTENESRARRLMAEGRDTEAAVTGLSSRGVYYHYTLDGRNYDAYAAIASEHSHKLQVGSSLTVRYLPSDPAHAYPSRNPRSRAEDQLIVWLMPCLLLGFPLTFATLQLSFVWPQHRLLAGGHASRAVVTRCRVSQGRSAGYVLYYEFPVPDSGLCQGKGSSGPPLAEGSVVTVLYDPNNPRRNAPYPMDTVRLAGV